MTNKFTARLSVRPKPVAAVQQSARRAHWPRRIQSSPVRRALFIPPHSRGPPIQMSPMSLAGRALEFGRPTGRTAECTMRIELADLRAFVRVRALAWAAPNARGSVLNEMATFVCQHTHELAARMLPIMLASRNSAAAAARPLRAASCHRESLRLLISSEFCATSVNLIPPRTCRFFSKTEKIISGPICSAPMEGLH